MKESIQSVRIELEPKETAAAVMSYLENAKGADRTIIDKAIKTWLESQKGYAIARVRVTNVKGGLMAVADGKSKDQSVTKFSDDPKEKRGKIKSSDRPNVGVGKILSEYLQDEKRKKGGGPVKIPFSTLYKDIKELGEFKTMDEDLFAGYVHDPRIAKDVARKLDRRHDVVLVR
jgi:hypothetical protein